MNKDTFIMWLCVNVVYTKANSMMPTTINQARNELPDCHGKCNGNNWATWTEWDICKGGECHLNEGIQSRQTYCFTLVTPEPSRSDGGSKEELKRKGSWQATCRQKQTRPCVRKQSCRGEWTTWGKWGDCEISSNARNATCNRNRRRLCHDKDGTRKSGSHCYGGPSSDTETDLCSNTSCTIIQQPRMGVVNDDIITPKKTTKEKPNIINHNTILIIAVAIGSLVFGALFVLLLLNLVRRSSSRDDESTSSRGDLWKRIGSTNTSSIGYSTGYAAAGDVMSPRLEFNIRSPSATASLVSSGSQQQFFGRGESISPTASEDPKPTAGLLTVSGNMNSHEPPRRRSRLMQENVYWEITEHTSSSDGSEESPSPVNDGREEVRNVLYGTTV